MAIELNQNFEALSKNYLFAEVARRVKEYRTQNPPRQIISLGIGDVTQPLGQVVVEAMKKASEEMGKAETFRGYGPEQGYNFVREAVASYYQKYDGIQVDPSDIFIGDGAKSDVAHITDLFGKVKVVISDPVYPVYFDSNVMAGNSITLVEATRENGFLPMPDQLDGEAALIYLCSPNNPTGAVYTYEQMSEWVAYARRTGSILLFDAAYERYIHGHYPHSIYEIEGAQTCAVEFCSFSKMAGFTGMRASWTVFPSALRVDGVCLRDRWLRRQSTKFNGLSYITQRAAQAALSDEGMAENDAHIAYYMENCRMIADYLTQRGIAFTGGQSSPYIWLACPDGMDSWAFFDKLLKTYQVVGTPGKGFGQHGEGYFRLTGFGSHEQTQEAIRRWKEGE